MLLSSVFTKSIWDARRSLPGWTVATAAVALMYAAFWPTVNSPEMADALAAYPDGMLAAFNADVDRKLEGTVWKSGCASWYADPTGRIAALWPDWTFAFRRQLATFDADSYDLRTPQRTPEPIAA